MPTEPYLADIRADSGFVNQVAVTVPPNRKFFLSESEFSLDEVNYVRLRAVGEEAELYSLPVTLAIGGRDGKIKPFLMRYNDAWTPPFIRRNEVAIKVAGGGLP